MLSPGNILFSVLLFFYSTFSFGQQNLRLVGDTLYSKKAWFKASEHYSTYRNSLQDSAERCYCTRQLARCYVQLNEINSAEVMYKDLIKNCNSDSKDLIQLAKLLQKKGEYEKARKLYAACYLSDTTDSYSRSSMLFCDSVKKSLDILSEIFLENMTVLNSPFDDVLNEAIDDTLFFLSKRKSGRNDQRLISDNQYQHRFYTWHPSLKSPALTHLNNDGFSSSTADGNEIYFTKSVPDSSQHGKLRTVIFRYKKLEEGKQEEQIFNYDDGRSFYGHPNISPNESYFFFISDTPGGFGGTDIYMCRKSGNRWTKPINLGPEINTSENELFPFYLGEGILFFASKGKAGYGGYDILATVMKNEKAAKAMVLHEPINSKADDLAFKCDKITKKFYVSSNRAKGKGHLDIYSIHNFQINNVKNFLR